jgi:F-type H+-transporting ATPase subunit delta
MARSKHDVIDSGRQHLGSVYAKALLGAAEKAGQSRQVLEELESLVQDVLDKLPQLDAAFASPRLSAEEKSALIDHSLGKRVSVTMLHFLKVLARHGRLDCLRAILQAAKKLYNELRGRVEVRVETAYPLSNPIRERIVARLTQMLGREVVLTTEINGDLLGGLVVRIGDTVYDGSVAARLKSMQEVTLEHTKQSIRQSLERFAVGT